MRINWFSYIRVTGLLLVLVYHFFPSVLPGGFIGVDVFFTFSGYLITALLIDEMSRTHRIDYLGFMRRRFYRIVPPLVLMVLICTPLALLVRNDFIAGIGHQITSVIGFVIMRISLTSISTSIHGVWLLRFIIIFSGVPYFGS